MLRITEQHTPDRLVLKLEGRLSGEWVNEVEACWRAAQPTDGAAIWVDMNDVCQVDAAGEVLLASMCRAGVHFVTRGCLMREVIREIACALRGSTSR